MAYPQLGFAETYQEVMEWNEGKDAWLGCLSWRFSTSFSIGSRIVLDLGVDVLAPGWGVGSFY
jgi:hypothetical protein